jgi:hypothetical protein
MLLADAWGARYGPRRQAHAVHPETGSATAGTDTILWIYPS